MSAHVDVAHKTQNMSSMSIQPTDVSDAKPGQNRGLHQKRRKRTHVFSPLRLVILVVSGVLLFIPGLALTIVGLQDPEADLDGVQKVMYQAIGPAMGTVGIALMFASCIYFNCYGTVPPQTPAQLTNQQSLSEQDQDDKGSIRSKQREAGQLHQQQVFNQQHNGRSVDVHTPDNDSRRTSTEYDLPESVSRAAHRTSGTTEENVPLTKSDDTTVLTAGI